MAPRSSALALREPGGSNPMRMLTAAQTVLPLPPALALRPLAALPLVGYPYGGRPELRRTAHLSPLTLLTG